MTLKIFEMFAGYGGASFALKKANISFECVGISEIKKTAIQTYNINHSNVKNYGDCTKIIPEELSDFDLLTAGFPCQDVSTSGLNDLSKGRSILINEVFRIVNIKKPKFIFLENVKGLISKCHKDFFNYIINSLLNLNYRIYYKILNSRDYNTPQNRPRIYFVCVRNDINIKFDFPSKEKYINDWHNYIDDSVNFKKVTRTFSHDIIKERLENFKNKKYVNCIQTQLDGYFSHTMIIPFEDYYRFLTPRECFRLQGFFNDEIKISHLTDNQAVDLAGDGWDINIVSKIFQCIPFNNYIINIDNRKILNNQVRLL